jgi:hypothetical protein
MNKSKKRGATIIAHRATAIVGLFGVALATGQHMTNIGNKS